MTLVCGIRCIAPRSTPWRPAASTSGKPNVPVGRLRGRRETVTPVATIQQRTRTDGSTAHRVVWRVDGRQKTKTFDSLVEAEGFRVAVETPEVVGRRLEITSLQMQDVVVTPVGGSASVQVAWKWVGR